MAATLAGQFTQATTDFDVVVLIKLPDDLRRLDALGHANGGQRIEAIVRIGEQFEFQRFEARSQAGG